MKFFIPCDQPKRWFQFSDHDWVDYVGSWPMITRCLRCDKYKQVE